MPDAHAPFAVLRALVPAYSDQAVCCQTARSHDRPLEAQKHGRSLRRPTPERSVGANAPERELKHGRGLSAARRPASSRGRRSPRRGLATRLRPPPPSAHRETTSSAPSHRLPGWRG
eukprot:6888058-Pyramimonas_sp.AAC.1